MDYVKHTESPTREELLKKYMLEIPKYLTRILEGAQVGGNYFPETMKLEMGPLHVSNYGIYNSRVEFHPYEACKLSIDLTSLSSGFRLELPNGESIEADLAVIRHRVDLTLIAVGNELLVGRANVNTESTTLYTDGVKIDTIDNLEDAHVRVLVDVSTFIHVTQTIYDNRKTGRHGARLIGPAFP